MVEKKFIKKKLNREEFVHATAKTAIRCWWVVHTEYGGYTEKDYTFHKWEDGSITISRNDGDDFVGIHDKETLDILRELLA